MRILLCPLSDGGYLYPTIAAGRELRRRGHHVSVLGRSGAAPVAADAGLPFAATEDFGERRAFSVAWWGTSAMAQYRATVRAARAGARPAHHLRAVPRHPARRRSARPSRGGGRALGPSVGLPGGRGRRTAPGQAPAESHPRDASAVRRGAGTGRAGRGPTTPVGDDPLPRATPCCCAATRRWNTRAPNCPTGCGTWGRCAGSRRLTRERRTIRREQVARSGKPVVYVHLGRVFEGGSGSPASTSHRRPVPGRGRAGTLPEPRTRPGRRHPDGAQAVDGPTDRPGRHGAHQRHLRPRAGRPGARPPPRGLAQRLRAAAAHRRLHAGRCGRAPAEIRAVGLAALLESAWRDDALRDRARALGRRLAAMDGAARAADIVERVAQHSAIPKEDHDYANLRP